MIFRSQTTAVGEHAAIPRQSVLTQARPKAGAVGYWLRSNPEYWLITAILLVAGLVHGINMFGFPFYETDEGTYIAQAWAVAEHGQLSHYTYWYDHAPWGWFQIAAWSELTGGFYTFGSSIDSGRVLMLLFQLGTTFLLYRAARSLSGSVWISTVTTLIFALSAFGIYYHRRVLLDNITTFWMMLAFVLLVSGRLTLTRVWLSAAALGISILSKELTIFLVPVMAYLVFYRSHGSQRWYSTVGWLALVGTIVSTYPLMATLKRELFPTGTWLGGDEEHVSLIEAIQVQSSRETDGGIFDPSSGFWREFGVWSEREPLLVIGGTACALMSIALIRRHRVAGVLGLMTLLLFLFLGRGGVIIGFYLVPLLPLLALNIAAALTIISGWARWVAERVRLVRAPALRVTTRGVLGCSLLLLVLPGHLSTEYQASPTSLWTDNQVLGQKRATTWVQQNLPFESPLIIDSFMWLELQDPPKSQAPFTGLTDAEWLKAHWYWKVDPDPEISGGVFQNDWSTVDYVVTTLQMMTDVAQNEDRLAIVYHAIENSTTVGYFETDHYPVEIRRVHKLRAYPASNNPMLSHTWQTYKNTFIHDGQVIDPSNGNTTSEAQSYALLRSVYLDDRETFVRVWDWTQHNLQVRDDHLLAWNWGVDANGAPGVLDTSNATDADQDVALALLFASKQWGEPAYQDAALRILDSIWNVATAEVASERVIVAGDWARGDGTEDFHDAVLNPSYFAPYAYRIFAEADPAHPWLDLVESSYNTLFRLAESSEVGGAQGIVPDWVMVDNETGEFRRADAVRPNAPQMSFDGSRLHWRLALDWLWFQDDNARRAAQLFDFPLRQLEESGTLLAAYHPDGSPAADYEALSMYAGTIPGLLFVDDRSAVHRLFSEKLARQYSSDASTAYWGDPNNYYDQNWTWFTTALIDGAMSNLWAGDVIVQWDEIFPERYQLDAGE